MTNGQLIDILSESPRDKKVVLNCKKDLIFEIGDICEYDNQIEIEQK